MKDEFVKYLNLIGIAEKAYIDKIESILEFASELFHEEIVDIFVEDYIKEDGTREYEDISLYSEKHYFAANNFMTNDDFFVINYPKKVIGFKIRKKDYDFKKATENSRLNIDVSYETGYIHGNFKASKENCDCLRKIFAKYILPYLEE